MIRINLLFVFPLFFHPFEKFLTPPLCSPTSTNEQAIIGVFDFKSGTEGDISERLGTTLSGQNNVNETQNATSRKSEKPHRIKIFIWRRQPDSNR